MKLELDTSKLLSKVDSHVTRLLMVFSGALAVTFGVSAIASIGVRFLAMLSGTSVDGGGLFGGTLFLGAIAGVISGVYWAVNYLDT